MSNAAELTFTDVAEHSSKKDLYVAIHDKVYDVTKFIDEHPGGEEVLLDVGGQDATEAFEDVGHSDEARDILNGMLIADLKRLPGDPAPKPSYSSVVSKTDSSSGSGMGVALYATIAVGAALAFGAYKYMETTGESK